jgi:hypothetical protein
MVIGEYRGRTHEAGCGRRTKGRWVGQINWRRGNKKLNSYQCTNKPRDIFGSTRLDPASTISGRKDMSGTSSLILRGRVEVAR